MRRGFAYLPAILAGALGCLAAEAQPRQPVNVPDDQAVLWRGVGQILHDGRSICTGALIAPDVVLTAAHCVTETLRGDAASPGRFAFRAGYRRGKAAATVKARAIDVHPGYVSAGDAYTLRKIRSDVARILLAEPIPHDKAPAYQVREAPATGGFLALATYGGDRREVGVQAPCGITGREREFITLTCHAVPGTSGAPIFELRQDNLPSIVAIVSGAGYRGRQWTTTLGAVLDHHEEWLGPTGPGRRPVVGGGAAKFVKKPNSGSRLPGGVSAGSGFRN